MENKLPKDIIVRNYNNFKRGLTELIGEGPLSKLIESVGGEDRIMYAPYSNTIESGAAYEGGFVRCAIRMAVIANKINDILPDSLKVDKKTINKIVLLSQISKVAWYEENDNNWEIANRGILYKYKKLEGALRTGERSTMLAMNAGVKFTPIEFEAMRSIDKASDDDNFIKYFSSPLSLIIRQSSEIISMENRNN